MTPGKKSVLLGGLLVISIVLSLPSKTRLSEAASVSQDTKVLKVGCSQPLNVPLGVETKKYLELIVDDFNKSGGLVVKGQRYKIDMIIYDDKYTPGGGKAAAERLLYQDKVKFIVPPLGSPAILGALTVTEPAKVICIFGGVSNKLKDPKIKYAFGGTGLTTLALWPYVRKACPQAKTAVFVTNDDETGHFNLVMNQKGAKFYGIESVREFLVPLGTTDFSPIGTTVAALKPDIVSAAGTRGGADTGLLIKALRQSGWRGPVVHNVFSEPDVLAACGKEAAEGYISLFSDTTQRPDSPPVATKLRQMYEAKYGTWNSTGMSWANPWYLFIAVVQKANSLEADDILAAANKDLVWQNLYGKAFLVKRPDLGNQRYIESLVDQSIGVYENGHFAYKDVTTPEETLKVAEGVLGFPGEWR